MKFICFIHAFYTQLEGNLMQCFSCACTLSVTCHEVRCGIFHLWHHVGPPRVSGVGTFWISRLGMLNVYEMFLFQGKKPGSAVTASSLILPPGNHSGCRPELHHSRPCIRRREAERGALLSGPPDSPRPLPGFPQPGCMCGLGVCAGVLPALSRGCARLGPIP